MAAATRKLSSELRWTIAVVLCGLAIGGAWRYLSPRPTGPLDLAKAKPEHAKELREAIKLGYVERYEWAGDRVKMVAHQKYLTRDKEWCKSLVNTAFAAGKAQYRYCSGVWVVPAPAPESPAYSSEATRVVERKEQPKRLELLNRMIADSYLVGFDWQANSLQMHVAPKFKTLSREERDNLAVICAEWAWCENDACEAVQFMDGDKELGRCVVKGRFAAND